MAPGDEDPDQAEVEALAPLGHYLALRVGFAFPTEEVNALPADWVACYTSGGFMLHDPVMRWIYANDGAIRWSEIRLADPMDILGRARSMGLAHGAAVAVSDQNAHGRRSFGTFLRADRDFTDTELARLEAYVRSRHQGSEPPSNLTTAELEVLSMVKEGLRLKQVAYELGVSEGAIKQRLRNAKGKLGAATGAQAAAKAAGFGLI